MSTLSKEYRRQLESTVLKAREEAERGAAAALESYGVGEARKPTHLDKVGEDLRKKLRAHGRQLGDVRRLDESQEVGRLINETAYEHWHRMLFARFLAENGFLIDPESGLDVDLDYCEEQARETKSDKWEVAAGFAQRMLTGVFRLDDPVLQLRLPTEFRNRLTALLASLPAEVFTASDSLGWTYQFWQTKRKEDVNKSGVKIGADEISPVTQLFTEDYMVDFLLDNTLGAWWAGKRMKDEGGRMKFATEEEARRFVALPGCPWKYLRFIKVSPGNEAAAPPSSFIIQPSSFLWTPAAGTFDGWPKTAAALRALDPCMGSGHFVVAMFERLVALRLAEEKLDEPAAVAAVIRDNPFGLEIDPRCTQTGAFNLALAAWRRVGYCKLPAMNLACSGLAPNAKLEDWLKLAEEGNHGNRNGPRNTRSTRKGKEGEADSDSVDAGEEGHHGEHGDKEQPRNTRSTRKGKEGETDSNSVDVGNEDDHGRHGAHGKTNQLAVSPSVCSVYSVVSPAALESQRPTTEHTEDMERKEKGPVPSPSVVPPPSLESPRSTTEHTEDTEKKDQDSAPSPPVCPVYSVVSPPSLESPRSTTDHTEDTERKDQDSAPSPSVCSVYSVVSPPPSPPWLKSSLHVAVARLLGYQWPRQTGSSFPDCPALGPDGLETHADKDGVVCFSQVRDEPPAATRLRTLLADAFGAEWGHALERKLIAATGSKADSLEDWLLNDFFAQHCDLFHNRPFVCHLWDGRKDGFNVLVNYHRLAGSGETTEYTEHTEGEKQQSDPSSSLVHQGRQTLESLTYAYLGDWITRQKDAMAHGEAGADDRLAAALELQGELKKILAGEPPYDLFIRWKALACQPIGWEPDLNDGVRLNIRPFLSVDLSRGKKGCGLFRAKPGSSLKWDKDRGKEPLRPKEDFPWFWGWDEQAVDFTGNGEFDGNRWNDCHYTTEFKRAARVARQAKPN